MEQFSVLKTPGYPKYHGNVSEPHYSEGYGYTIAYYEPIYDLELKIPGLGISHTPFIPIQHVRSSRGTRPFVPRHLTEQDMIQINLRSERRAKDILKDFHPAQKETYESARDFRIKKEIERRIEEIRESCANVHNYYRKTGKYDVVRKNICNGRSRGRLSNKSYPGDVILDKKIENINDIKAKLGEDKDNHRAKFKLYSAGCSKDKVVEGIEEKLNAEDQEVKEEKSGDAKDQSTARRSSRETRAEQLKVLQERFKNQETESDRFERSFGRHLSKLRIEVNSLTQKADDYIADNKYQSFKMDQIFRNKNV